MTSEQDVVEFILAKGGEIREMKASGSTKDVIMKHVEALQKLKQIYEVNAVFMWYINQWVYGCELGSF